jgi:hypothetical protein
MSHSMICQRRSLHNSNLLPGGACPLGAGATSPRLDCQIGNAIERQTDLSPNGVWHMQKNFEPESSQRAINDHALASLRQEIVA